MEDCRSPGRSILFPSGIIGVRTRKQPIVATTARALTSSRKAKRNRANLICHRRRYNPRSQILGQIFFHLSCCFEGASDLNIRRAQASSGDRTFSRPRPIFVLFRGSQSVARPAALSYRRKTHGFAGSRFGFRRRIDGCRSTAESRRIT